MFALKRNIVVWYRAHHDMCLSKFCTQSSVIRNDNVTEDNIFQDKIFVFDPENTHNTQLYIVENKTKYIF